MYRRRADDENYIKATLIDLYTAVLITFHGARFTVFRPSMVHLNKSDKYHLTGACAPTYLHARIQSRNFVFLRFQIYTKDFSNKLLEIFNRA